MQTTNIITKNRVYRKYNEVWDDICIGKYGLKLNEEMPLKEKMGHTKLYLKGIQSGKIPNIAYKA